MATLPVDTFNPMILLAIASDLPSNLVDCARNAANHIVSLTNAKMHAVKSRPWGSRWGLISGESDIALAAECLAMFRPGIGRSPEPSLKILGEEDWTLAVTHKPN